jgi:hypothetical protein
MPGPICAICADPTRLKRANELIAAGNLSDRKIADQLGLAATDAGRVTVWRHRKKCVEQTAMAIVQAANKGRAVVDKREQSLAAVEAGDPVETFLSLREVTVDLRRTHERLQRVADMAETDNQRALIAALAAQELKALDHRARLGGLRGFTPPAATPANLPVFNLTMHFSDGTRTQIAAMPVVDVVPDATVVDDEDV